MPSSINPKVSVVMAVKNEEQHIQEAIESILNQSLSDIELIIVNDNSTDNTWQVAEKISQQDQRVCLHQNLKSGKCSAFNYGISLAKGDYVCLFAGDDIMPPDSLTIRYQAVSSYAPNEKVIGLCKLQSFSKNKKFDGHIVPKGENRGGFTGVSYLMSRGVLISLFPVPENLPNEDTWLELAIKNLPDLIHIHSGVIGCKWRVHDGNSINMTLDYEKYNRKYSQRMEAIRIFYEKHYNELSAENALELMNRITCEEYRRKGQVLKLLTCNAKLVERLRAVSTANAFFYNIRRMLFGLLSGF